MFEYDVFISYSGADKSTAIRIAEDLKRDGLRVWIDEWLIRPGDSIPVKIDEGLEQSRVLVSLLSAAALESDWTILERNSILFRDPTNTERRFIPVMLDRCELKGSLRQFAYIDWTDTTDDQYQRLLHACGPVDEPVQTTNTSEASKTLQTISFSIRGMAISPDGRELISGFADMTVRAWNLDSENCETIHSCHTDSILGISISSSGSFVVTGGADSLIVVWDLKNNCLIHKIRGNHGRIHDVLVTADNKKIISASSDGSLRLWDVKTGKSEKRFKGHAGEVLCVTVDPTSNYLYSGSADRSIKCWDANGNCITTLKGHVGAVTGLSVSNSDRKLVSCSEDRTIRIWDLKTSTCIATLEGHTEGVSGVAVRQDTSWIVSASRDRTAKLWNIETGQCLANYVGHIESVNSIAISPDGQRTATVSFDGTVKIWNLPSINAVQADGDTTSRYTNAKVLLVGDTGVGKSGLSLRLTQEKFEATVSTDGAWATQMRLSQNEEITGREREIWLWDFAGQSDYRLIHQLFLDEASLAVLVFNPQSDEPFESLGQWSNALSRAARGWDSKQNKFEGRSLAKILVAGRCDRGGLTISKSSVDRFREERGFCEYVETSALTGEGCSELKDKIIRRIPWDDIPWTASPRTFQLLKEKILELKDEGSTLFRIAELKQQVEFRLPQYYFSTDELRAVVGLLVSPGVVWHLEFGDFVLLQPEVVNSYAAAVIRKIRAHSEEIGCIQEDQLLAGDLNYQDMVRLETSEEAIVLRALHQTFVERGLCLREKSEYGPLLVFPSYFKRERPGLEDHPTVFVTYSFTGALDEIYSTLIVRLQHTSTFEKKQLWRFAADFETQEGKRVGLKMLKKEEGSAEVVVYLDPSIPDDTKVTFMRYVHDHLDRKAGSVERLRHYSCGHCHTPVENHAVVRSRISKGKKDILCVSCEKRVVLNDIVEKKFGSAAVQGRISKLDAMAKNRIDAESLGLVLIGHCFAIAGESGHIFKTSEDSPTYNGSFQFKDRLGAATHKKVRIVLETAVDLISVSKHDRAIHVKIRDSEYRKVVTDDETYFLVCRTNENKIKWMNLSHFFRRLKKSRKKTLRFEFNGEDLTALSLVQQGNRVLSRDQRQVGVSLEGIEDSTEVET